MRSFVCAVAAAAVVVACSAWEIPNKRCRATTFSGEDAAATSPAGAPCASCVNAQCCDAVGHCDETAGCNQRVGAARSCLLAAGPAAGREEESCRKNLEDQPEAVSTYTCMREKCGTECQIPSCDVDRAATAVVNGKCDRCVTASCCTPINECYGDRGCKNVLECIFGKCGPQLGKELLLDQSTGFRADPCAGDGGGSPGQPIGFEGCIANCIRDFGAVQNDFRSACRAFSVFRCAAQASCGVDCLVSEDGGVDAGQDAADASDAAKSSDAADAADAPKD